MIEYIMLICLLLLVALSDLGAKTNILRYIIDHPDTQLDSGSVLNEESLAELPAEPVVSSSSISPGKVVFALPAVIPLRQSCQTTRGLYERMNDDISLSDSDMGHLKTPSRLRTLVRQTFGRPKYATVGEFDARSNGEIDLITHVQSSSNASVFFGTRSNDVGVPYVVKHLNNCKALLFEDRNSHVDPLTHEYVLSKVVLEQLPSLLPAMLWISRPVPLTNENADSLGFRGSLIGQCVKAHGMSRTIIQARAGIDVSEAINYAAKSLKKRNSRIAEALAMVKFLQTGLAIGRKSLELLRDLHSIAVIHGDVHSKNIVFSDPKMNMAFPDVHSMQLIDLGHAGIVCGAESHLETPKHLNQILLAPWQLGFVSKRGFRDDVFRAVEMLAGIMSFGTLRDYMENLPSRILKIKRLLPYFGDYKNYQCFSRARKAGVNEQTIRVLSVALSEILDYVRSIWTFDTPVMYDFIFARLDEAEAALKPRRSWLSKFIPHVN